MGDVKVLDKNPVSGGAAPIQTGSLNKEASPINTGLPELKPAGPETRHSIDQELAELGIKEINDRPGLTGEHKEIGIEYSDPAVPVVSGPTESVRLPDTKDIGDSNTWLNALADKVRKVMRLLGF